ncbi:MAG: metallophosphoesterase family protein [Desulfatiglandales bacterium]
MAIKVGVLSDTHLKKVTPALIRIYERHLAGVDVLLHAGDVVSTEVIRFLDRGAFYGVHGNMDPPDVRELLPQSRVVELGGWRIGLAHGTGGPESVEETVAGLFSDIDIIVYGHSHIHSNRVRNGILFFNPGTATGHCRKGANTLGFLELSETVQGRIVEIDSQ